MNIIGSGLYIPQKKINNNFFSNELKLDTNSNWIESKTGIVNRYYAIEETVVDMATNAAKEALNNASLNHVDMIIVATTTPDTPIPSVATFVANRLGIKCAAFDVNNACSGFVFATEIASNFLNDYNKILIIGVDKSTKLVNFKDRLTSIFFADGAGAIIIEKSDKKISSYLMSEGNHEAISTLNSGKLEMIGKEIWDFTHKCVPDVLLNLSKKSNIYISNFDWLVPHQPNSKMIESCLNSINFPINKTIINVNKYGNTISASIPIALHEGISSKIKRNDIVALVGWGAGLSWGGILFQY